MTWLLMCLAAFAGAVGAHALLCRINLRMSRVSRFLLVGIPVAMALFGAVHARYNFWSVETIGALLLFGFMCELYIFLFTATISSISSNILFHLSRRPLNIAEVAALYDSSEMVRLRLERLQNGGFVVSKNGNLLSVSAKGAFVHGLLRRLRIFFRQSESDD